MEKDMKYYVEHSGDVLRHNIKRRDELTSAICELYSKSQYEDITIIASGSSLNAALSAKNFMDRFFDGKVVVVSPTEYLDYRKEYLLNSFKIVISQSGCSTNIIEVLRDLNRNNLEYVVLTGNVLADVKDYSNNIFEYGVGNEIIDFVTLGFTTLIEYLVLFSLQVGKIEGQITEEEYNKYIVNVEQCAISNQNMYRKAITVVDNNYDELLKMDKAIIVADGANMGIAREAALKFQETLRIPAVYYESEEYIHGPNMQLTPDYVVFFIDTNQKHDRMLDILRATNQVTNKTYLITNKNLINSKVIEDRRVFKADNNIQNDLSPLFTVVPFQYISAYVTKEKNDFKTHPLFARFEELVQCKSSDYDEIMEEKKRRG